MDCHARQILGWQLSRSAKATTAAATLISCCGVLGRVPLSFLLRSDKGLVLRTEAGSHHAALSAAGRHGQAVD